jgi:Bacterial Ig-like domain (group 1)/PKD domain
MLTRFRRDDIVLGAVVILLAVAIPLGVVSCDKVPLLAPTGTVITLIPTSNTLSLNSQIDIVATVIENGAAAGTGTGSTTSAGAGTPVQNGTVVTFTTTIGRIEPAEARTHNGKVTVRLISAGQSGTARVTAFSGGASSAIDVKVGATGAERVVMSAVPQTLPADGGSSAITAVVADIGGAGLSNIPVTFTTSAGTVSPATTTTDSNGLATTTLTTGATATVTARIAGAPNDAGGGSGATGSNSVTVTVGARPLSTFTANPTFGPAGTPITFTVTPSTGANISGGTISYGDGASDSLGAITGAATFVHAYSSAGQFTARVTANDVTSGSQTLESTVVIGAASVTLAADPTSPAVGAATQLTATLPANVQAESFKFTFDDGTAPVTQTGNTLSHAFPSPGNHTVRVDVTLVGGAVATAFLTLTVL